MSKILGVLGNMEHTLKNSAYRQGIPELTKFSPFLGGLAGELLAHENPNGWMAKANSRPDPLLTYTWTITLPSLSGGLALGSEYIEDISVSSVATTPHPYFREGRYKFISSAYQPNGLTLTLYEDERLTGHAYINSWVDSIVSPNAFAFQPTDKYQYSLTLTAQTQQWQDAAKVKFLGVWPLERPGWAFGSEGDKRVNFEVPCSFNDVEITFYQTRYGGVAQKLFGSLVSSFPGLSTIIGGLSSQLGIKPKIPFPGMGSFTLP